MKIKLRNVVLIVVLLLIARVEYVLLTTEPMSYEDQQFLLAKEKFLQNQTHYIQIVNSTPEEKDGSPKIVAFNLGGFEGYPQYIVWDESDDLANPQSQHRRFVAETRRLAPGVKDPPDFHILIYKVTAQKLDSHFYWVMESSEPFMQSERVNGRWERNQAYITPNNPYIKSHDPYRSLPW